MKDPQYIYEDGDIVVVDKPAGMIVHPAPGHESGALTDFVLARFPEIAGVGSDERPGIVHRLDIETSGVMVLARTERAYMALRRAFERHDAVKKTYLAVLHGAPSPACGELNTLIGRRAWDPKRMAVLDHGGKMAITRWSVLQKKGRLAVVEFEIETGRTHQIRVHAAHLGHPVAGDALYGNPALDRMMAVRPSRHLLHAVELSFPHPASGRRVVFSAPPPADIVYAR